MLCDPVSYTDRPSILSSTSLQEGTLTLLHVETDMDMPFIFESLKKESAKNWDIQPLLDNFKKSFSYIAGSHTSQAFIVKLNGLPIFEIEAHEGPKHAPLHSGFQAADGDYFIILIAGHFDQAAFSVYISSLQLCLEYFFGYSEVKRIIAPVYDGSDREQRAQLLIQAGLKGFLEKTTPTEPDLFTIYRL